MDPLSITASLVTLLGVVGQFSKALQIVAQLKKADAQIAQSSSQLAIIQDIVESLEAYQGAELAEPDTGIDSGRARGKIVGAIRSLIEASHAAFPKTTGTSRCAKHIKQLRWVIRDHKAVSDLQNKLNDLGNLLMIALQAEATNETRSLTPILTSLSAKQDLLHSDVIYMKADLSALAHDSFKLTPSPPPEYGKPVTKRRMQASVMRGMLNLPGVMIQYCQSAGQRKRYSVLFGFKVPGSKVVFAQLSGQWCNIGIPNLCVRVKNIVPEDSEIFTACKVGNVVAVRDLLQTRKAGLNDITSQNETLLTAACYSREVELVELLLTLGADPNQTCGMFQTSPLQISFGLNEPELARRLLCHDADIDYASGRGWNVIHHLWRHTEEGRPEANEEFYHMCSAIGFDAHDTQDTSGWTHLHRAAAYGTARDITALLSLGASVITYTSQNAWTPIHVAAWKNNIGALKVLSKCVSLRTLHSPDAHGWTPLHIAVEREAEDTMRFLLKNGANPHAQTNITATWFPVGLEHQILCPVDLALNCGQFFFEKYVEALEDAGWKVTTSLDGEDIFWDSLEYLVDGPPQYEKSSFDSSWNGSKKS